MNVRFTVADMPRVTDEHRAARREQIVAAARRCVAREGFHKTTMAHVIRESGLSAGAVYGYFKGKDELIRAIAEAGVGQFADVLADIARGDIPVTLSGALGSVLQQMRAMADETGGDFPRVAVHAWSEAARDETVRGIVRDNIARVHAGWVDVVDRAAADGNLPDGDHASMARVMLGLMPGFVLQGLLLGEVDAEEYVAAFATLVGDPAAPR